MRLKHKNRKTEAAAILLVVSITTVFFYWLWWSYYSIIFQKDFPAEVYVAKKAGFSTDPDIVRFGIVPPGSSGMRRIDVQNVNVTTVATIEVFGKISRYIEVSENDVVLAPNQNKSFSVFVTIPDDAKTPDYFNGTIRVTLRQHSFIDFIL